MAGGATFTQRNISVLNFNLLSREFSRQIVTNVAKKILRILQAEILFIFNFNFIFDWPDFDECLFGGYNCTGVSSCVNDIGGYHCVCPHGYNLTHGNNCSGGVIFSEWTS